MTGQVLGATLVALALEGLIGIAAQRGTVAVGWLLLGHLAVVAMLAVWARSRVAAGREASAPLLLLLVTTVAGPIGAAGALLALPFLARPAKPSPLLAAWYERISNSTEVDAEAKLAESVLAGRTLETDAPPPARLLGIMTRGSLVERQTALGLIARKFDPAYGLALQAALKSPEPVVRVQAAAVAARVRGTLKREVRTMLSGLTQIERDANLAASTAARLEGAARSGLLDEAERARAEAAVTRLRAALVTSAAATSTSIPRLPSAPAAAREAERALIAAGRFRELRVARRLGALGRRGLSVRPRRAAHTAAAVRPDIATADSGAPSA